MVMNYTIATIPRDGIGTEVMDATVQVLKARAYIDINQFICMLIQPIDPLFCSFHFISPWFNKIIARTA
jgi:hypothetical protein